MDDNKILELYFNRSESAIAETKQKYGNYCLTIATNILGNSQDAEECVNDTYMKAWGTIPPQRPPSFRLFLGKIVRNLSLNKMKAQGTQKRGGGETPLLLSEMEGCVPSARNVEDEVDVQILAGVIDDFLSNIRKEDRVFFVRRYRYADTISAIAKRYSVGESKVKMSLSRTRNKLKGQLEKEGILT